MRTWKIVKKASPIIDLLPEQDWTVVGWVLGIKILLFFVVAKSYALIWNSWIGAPHRWLEIWDQWDVGYYQEIAEFGYRATDGSLAFYPLFPWLVHLAASISGSCLAAGLIVSGIASVIAAVLLRRLVVLDYRPTVAMRSVWFFLIFPTAYFLHVGYSESLFLAFALACILAARHESWCLAGFLGALCWMTRAPGAIIMPTLVVEAVQQYRQNRRWKWSWLWIAIVPAGFAVYLLTNWQVSGDPFLFLEIRRASFEQWLASPLVGIRQAIRAAYPSPNEAEMVGKQELLYVALGFVCMIVSWVKLRPSYATWMTASWILYSSVNFFRSIPRYTLTMFPIFILFALLAKKPFWGAILTFWSLLFLALFAVLFAHGEWAF